MNGGLNKESLFCAGFFFMDSVPPIRAPPGASISREKEMEVIFMKKKTTKSDDFYENMTTNQVIRQYLQMDRRRQNTERRKDRRHRANIRLIEGVSEGLLQRKERESPAPEESLLAQIRMECLYEALRQLKPVDRQFLFLRFFCGWRLRQIAVLYEISESAVSQRIKKNLQNLEKTLRENA